MATKVSTIKLNELTKIVDRAITSAGGRKLPGPIICGRILRPSEAEKINVNAVARDITKQASAAFPGLKLTPKVIIDDIITMGFIIRNPVEF